ncbi:hypothetical protein JOC36_000826 [Weissella uvarum]|uniref:hypothetical protein n=1 Tax=Lactobacillaceae TaxID=33958 RepID=UPI0019613D01|nr:MULTISPECIES: hypothetical protein [Lactobacillaceae]MBM7617277.1 hypothetical protein [Weissella uvarum]MCM0595219.1 hypothetical protein [Weissella uvarum]MCM0601481.1 hypothetical protein [Periweissella ghanensis]
MKFDEAIDKIYLNAKGCILDATVSVHLVKEVLINLEEEYAKPVRMTREEYNNIMKLKENGVNPFDIATVKNGSEEYDESVGNELMYRTLNVENLMRAWLHPELIKVVEE